MKKKIFVAAVAAIVAVGAAWNLSQANESNALSDLTLSNVEALAQETNVYLCMQQWPWDMCQIPGDLLIGYRRVL